MSTPTGNSPENVSPSTTQHTPVIIKTGGDGVPDSPNIRVDIESRMMDFIGSESSRTWISSRSSLAGRLTELTIRDGKDPLIDKKITPGEMATIRIEYGSFQIRLWESVVPTSNDIVVLNIESDISFTASKPGKWDTSWAIFPPIKSVLFMAGNKTHVNYTFKHSAPTLEINYDRTEIPHPFD